MESIELCRAFGTEWCLAGQQRLIGASSSNGQTVERRLTAFAASKIDGKDNFGWLSFGARNLLGHLMMAISLFHAIASLVSPHTEYRCNRSISDWHEKIRRQSLPPSSFWIWNLCLSRPGGSIGRIQLNRRRDNRETDSLCRVACVCRSIHLWVMNHRGRFVSFARRSRLVFTRARLKFDTSIR